MCVDLNRLVKALKSLKLALDRYLDDAEFSGLNEYDLDKLAPIPRMEPTSDAVEEDKIAWSVKASVIDVQREYAALGQCPQPTEEGCPLPDEYGGLTSWKKLLAHSRTAVDAAAIYNAGLDFRNWVEAEARRRSKSPRQPHWDKKSRTLYLEGEQIRPPFRRSATLSFLVLDAFEKYGWPVEITSPISSRLDRVLESINKGLRSVQFYQSAGGDKIGWRQKVS